MNTHPWGSEWWKVFQVPSVMLGKLLGFSVPWVPHLSESLGAVVTVKWESDGKVFCSR